MKDWLSAVMTCCLLVALTVSLVPSEGKRLCELAGTAVLMIVLLSPVRSLGEGWFEMTGAYTSGEYDPADAKIGADELRESLLERHLEECAASRGYDCGFEAETGTLAQSFVCRSVRIYPEGELSLEQRDELTLLVTRIAGVSAEDVIFADE